MQYQIRPSPRYDARRVRRRKLPRGLAPEFPERTAQHFAKEIAKIGEFIRKRIKSEIVPAMKAGREKAIFAKLNREVKRKFSDKILREMLTRLADAEILRQRRLFNRALGKVLGVKIVPVDPAELKDALQRVAVPQGLVAIDSRKFVSESMKNITSVRDTMTTAMTNSLVRARALGQSPEELADFWVKKGIPVSFGTVEGRAKVIARDQMGNLNSELARTNQENAGIDSYIWRTEGDDRVRPTHEAREGQEFKWNDPPEGGAPGEDVQCRCHAEPSVKKSKVLKLLTGFAVRAGFRILTG